MNRTSKTIAASMLLAASPVIVASGAATTPLGALAAEQRSLANNVLELEAGQLVAKINDSPLYAENLMVLNEQLQASIPPHRLIERMVELRLIADKARQGKLTSDPLLGAEIQNAIDNALATAYLKHFIANLEIDEEAISRAYEEFIRDYPRENEYKAAHILVESREQAEEIISQLESGADFATLAKEHSQDPGSARQGGDLGWFKAQQMVPSFSEAVVALKPNSFTDKPVESQFGWHVIYLDQTRLTPLPKKADVRAELISEYQREQIEAMLAEVREQAHIEITDARFLTDFSNDDSGKAGNGTERLPQSPSPALP